MVASERDFAVCQMKEMAEQVQTVAGEFKSMADHCDHILKQLEQVRTERETAIIIANLCNQATYLSIYCSQGYSGKIYL